MQIQLPLFLSFEQIQEMPIIKKYEQLFAVLDLSHLPEFNCGVGADGTSQHALLRAFIINGLAESARSKASTESPPSSGFSKPIRRANISAVFATVSCPTSPSSIAFPKK